MAFDNLFSKQEYLVTQSNDLTRSFENLTAFKHKLLDFCFSFVQKDDTVDKIYKTDANVIIHHFGLTLSESNYQRVIKRFKILNEKQLSLIILVYGKVEWLNFNLAGKLHHMFSN